MRALWKFRFLAVFVLPAVLIAQNADEAKLKQQRRGMLIEQTLADLQNLKLGENRAIVNAKIGNLLWETDQKRARGLFQNAANELINAQTLAEANPKNLQFQNDLLMGQSTRPLILNTIAARDAELALELLARTRPAAITKALSMGSVKTTKINNSNNLSYLAQNELSLEQNLCRLAADQDPDRAAKILKDSLTKTVSSESINLLKKLAEKDSESAADVASKIADKITEAKFSNDGQPDYQILQAAIAFLNEFIAARNPSDHALKLDDGQMQQLADKLFSYFLGDGSREAYYLTYSVIPIAEKLSPTAVDKLKSLAKTSPRGDMGFSYDPDLQKLLSSDTTPEQLLAEAKKYPVNEQRQIYQTAANKLAAKGDMSRAAEVLKENFSDDALDEALNNLNWQYSNNLIGAGKFNEAEQAIDQMPENSRVNPLVNLANSIYQQKPVENKTYALGVITKARALTAEKPETTNEMSNLMQVIGAYATIEPAEGFRMYEALVPQMNDLSDAAAVINGFQGGSNIRDGEYVMNQGSYFGFYGADYSMLQKFAASDFDRTIKLLDSFTRREVRLSLKLQLIEGLN